MDITASDPRRRLLRDLAAVLVLAGILLALDVAITLVWREPVTAVIGVVRQTELDQGAQRISLTGLDRHALAGLASTADRIAFLARRDQRQARTGSGIGRIVIPRLGVDFEIVQGTDPTSLETGPGHYPGTGFPGEGRTVAIAGHRTTYLAPFRHLDGLRAGDAILVRMPYGSFTYAVTSSRIVVPSDVSVVDDTGSERLVLSACNPLFSAAQRIVVVARLTEMVPRGAALGRRAVRVLSPHQPLGAERVSQVSRKASARPHMGSRPDTGCRRVGRCVT